MRLHHCLTVPHHRLAVPHHRLTVPHHRLAVPYHRLAVLVSLLFASAALPAQSWDPFPKLLPGQQAAVRNSVDGPHYDELRRCLKTYRSAVGARYYAAVVEVSAASGSTSPQLSNAVPYVDALYQAWRSNGRLDPDTHVLLAISLENRGIAIHPGIRWADLGFEGTAVTQAIGGSRFADLARGGDYGRALCALAEHVDRRLAELDRSSRKRTSETRDKLAQWQTRSAQLEEHLAELDALFPELASRLHAQLSDAGLSLSSARSALDQGRFGEARSALAAAESEIPRLEEDVRKAREAHGAFPGLNADVERRRRELEATPGSGNSGFDDARALLGQCARLASTAELDLLEGRPAGLGETRRCLERYAHELKITLAAYNLVYKVVPLTVAAITAGVVALLAILRLRRRRRARRRMEEEVGRWKSKVASSAERLFELEQQYPLYFSAGSRRWSGESGDLDQQCADAVNQLFLLYSKAVDLLDRAERQASTAHGVSLSPRSYDQVWELLRSSPVRFETGEVEERRRILLPLRRAYEGTALSLLDDLEAAYTGAASLLEQVNAIEDRHAELMEAAKQASSDATLLCTHRGDLGLPTAPLLEALESAAQLLHGGDRLLGDPVKAAEVLDGARQAFVRVGERARLGNSVVEELRGPIQKRGEELRVEVRRLREAQFRLEEPGFQPDVELDRGVREALRAEQLVSAGQEEEAHEALAVLRVSLQGLGEQLRAVEKARDGVLPALETIESAAAAIRERLPQGRATLDRLRGEFALETYHDASDNLEELDRLLSELASWSREIRRDHAEQHYLSALSTLEECEELVRSGTGLLDEIEQTGTALSEIREHARELAAEDERLLSQVEPLLGRPGIGHELTRRAPDRLAEIRELFTRCSAARPNWPVLEAELDEARGDLEALRATLEEELAAYRRSRDLEQELRGRLQGLSRRVEEEFRDRPHVGQTVARALEDLGRWQDRIEEGSAGGGELLASGESLAASLERAEQTWRGEMELVRTAETELRAAQAELRQVRRRGFGYGVVADAGPAQSLVRRAEGCRDRQQWEEVLAQAGQARRSLEEEVSRCQRRARQLEEQARRRAERLRRQRQWKNAVEAAVVVGSALGGGSGSGSSGLRRRGPSLGPSFGSSFSNRGGSSFGGTRSGGSSW